MRGMIDWQQEMFFSFNVEERIPQDHPLRAVKRKADAILQAMDRDFSCAYSQAGRPSIPPEQLLKALLLQALFSIPSEARLVESIAYNFLYRWFLDMPLDAKMWTPEVFSMNRKRFEDHGLVRKFFDRIVATALAEELASCDHFTVDGTLIRSHAGHKSIVPRENTAQPPKSDDGDKGNPTINYRGEKRKNDTHYSKTDPEARIARKGPGKEAQLSHSGHVLMENRNGLVIDIEIDAADGHAERRAARTMIMRSRRRHRKLRIKTIGFDAGYDDGKFLEALEQRHKVIPHVPIKHSQNTAIASRQRAIKREKTKGFAVSQRIRKRVEEIFGWGKTTGRMARTRFVGRWKIVQEMLMTACGYNLLRLANIERRAAA